MWWLIRKTLGKCSKVYGRLLSLRSSQKSDVEVDRWCEDYLSDCTVLNGPFKGMLYPELRAVGSMLYPKLLGSYERELEHVMEYATSQPYSVVVDIGCAEGYYAVGIARSVKGARVYAYDTDAQALALCRRMADVNGVTLNIGGFCDKSTLMGLDLGQRALIISDCEGYEAQLFDEELVNHLIAHDLLIEMHDFLDIEISGKLTTILSKTHEVEIIESVDDLVKVYSYTYDELSSLSLKARCVILKEQRPTIMKWIFAKARRQI